MKNVGGDVARARMEAHRQRLIRDKVARMQDAVDSHPSNEERLRRMRQTVRALGHLAEASIELKAKQRLLAAFRDWRSRAD